MNKKLTPAELEQLIHRELRALPPRKAPAGFEARLHAAVEARTGAQSAAAQKLEQLVHRELRALPPRKAPGTLEARVMAAIEAQAAVAWYHKSWSYWPAGVRGAFLAVATTIAGAVIYGGYRALSGADATAHAVSTEVGERFAFFTQLFHGLRWTIELGNSLVATIPPLWLYGGLAFAAVIYTAFFGLGAAAYRTLYRTTR